MEDNNERLSRKIYAKWKNSTMKNRIRFVILVWVIILLVVMTITTVAIDPTIFTDPVKRNDWLTRMAILESLSVYGIIFGEQTATDSQLSNPAGLYQKKLAEYKESREHAIPHIQHMADWLVWFKKQELYKKKMDFLLGMGITDAEYIIDCIDQITPSDLLTHPVQVTDSKGNIHHIRMRNEEQIKAIEYVKHGRIKMETYPSNYYISQYDEGFSTYALEEAPRLAKMENETVWFSRLTKIGSTIIVGVLFAMITVNDLMRPDDLQGWLNMVMRISALLVSIGSGWYTAVKIVRIKAWKLDDKCMILERFVSDLKSKVFVPKTDEEKAKEEVEEYERIHGREQEEPDGTDTAGTSGQPDGEGVHSEHDKEVSVAGV